VRQKQLRATTAAHENSCARDNSCSAFFSTLTPWRRFSDREQDFFFTIPRSFYVSEEWTLLLSVKPDF
jgi:hypothetical protein